LSADLTEINGQKLCPTCLHDKYVECAECGELILRGEAIHVNGQYYCEDCFHESYFVCPICGGTYLNEDRREDPNGESVCEACFNDNYVECSNCGEIVRIDDSREAFGNVYCDDCFREEFSTCDECGALMHNDDSFYDEGTDRYLCETCWNNRGDDEDESIIHQWDFRPYFNFYKLEYEHSIFMGFELEIENPHTDSILSSAEDLLDFMRKEKTEKFFYLKQDSSLDYGFEIVSHPSTLMKMKDMKLYNLLKYLRRQGFTSYDNGRCGLHIHTSWTKNDIHKNQIKFDKEDKIKLAYFFLHNKEEIGKLYARKHNGYASEWAPHQVLQYEIDESYPGRHFILNYGLNDDVEFRGAKGTLYYPRFIATLQFTECVVLYVLANGRTHFFRPCWNDFMEFARRMRYDDFYTFMKNKNKKQDKESDTCA
ncbi:MAG: hypothetical protein JRC60_06330, partial [Deltaproteobacteria bacterium]|nr:hypothetical protein [Deltaproteobacteria bacterium]